MSEPTRRDVLKTGAAAIATGLAAGCSDSEGASPDPTNSTDNNSTDSSTQEQSAEASYEDELELFDKAIDPNVLKERGAVPEFIGFKPFSVSFRKKMFEAVSPEFRSGDADYIIDGVGDKEINYAINQPTEINSTNYTLDNEEIISGLVDAGYERDFKNENVDSRDWELLIDRDKESIDNPETYDLIAAVKENTAIFVPNFEDLLETDDYISLEDYEEGLQIAIDTYDGEIDSHIEADHYESDVLEAMREFMSGDLEELEDFHGYDALVNPEDADEDVVGELFIDKFEEDGDYLSQEFKFVEKERRDRYEPMNPEIDPEHYTREEMEEANEEAQT